MSRALQLNEVKHILKQGLSILKGKNEDYAGGNSAFSNFEFTSMCLEFAIKQGLTGVHLSFLALITTKLARLISLLGGNKTPNNEALGDTFIDACNYAALWGGYVASEVACDIVCAELVPQSIDETEAALDPSYYLDAEGRINPYAGKSEVAEGAVVFPTPKNFIGVYFDKRSIREQHVVFYGPHGTRLFEGHFQHDANNRLVWIDERFELAEVEERQRHEAQMKAYPELKDGNV